MDSKFIHLHTHSHYSLLDGMSKIDELVKKAKQDGQSALAITDHGNLYGAIEFYKTATKAGIKPILGVEAYIAPGDHKQKSSGVGKDKYFHLVLLVKNQIGWENLISLVTKSYLEGFYYKPRMDKEMLREHSEGLIALSGCLGGELSQALLANRISDAEKIATEYREIFGPDNYYIEIGKHSQIEESEKIEERLINLAKKLEIPLVATRDSHYIDKEDRPVHDILLCIQTGKTMKDEKRFQLEDDFHFSTQEEMINDFAFLPEAIDNTLQIANMCDLKLELGKILLPSFTVPPAEGEPRPGKPGQDTGRDISGFEYLKNLVSEKIGSRYKDPDREDVKKRVEYELGVIEQMGFSDYFLIVADFIGWAKERGIVVGPGRGSAAGSIISYILGITDLDPLEYGLLFERFLNPSRIQMPDIDIDITDTRRDEVFGYLAEKYGEDHVAHIITFGTMAARAAIRDVGRALDIELSFCDRLAKLVPFGKNLDQALKLVPEFYELYKRDERASQIIDAAKRLEGVARHASVHACGTVISADPLTKRVPLQYSPQKDNIVITQFEMHAIEDLGLLKMDLLGLKNLTIIENTLRLIEDKARSAGSGQAGEKIDISQLPLDDKKTFGLLQSADTVGVFQLESGGMRRYLKDLKPTELEDIIAMVALYRPGPMELIPSYIARKFGKEEVSYIHPRLEPILKNTYGIGIYQEQMMRIASDLAGYSLAEADTLRKAIGKKIKRLLDQQEEKLVKGLIDNGIPEATAKRIWDLFPPFARYGFNRSHAASYAMIAYRTAYLKANYPVEFMTALFNADSGDVERIAFLISEAKKMGIEVLPPDVNKSSSVFIPENKNIRFGLAAIKNIGNAIVEAIVEERVRGGEFESFVSFITRVKHKDLNKKSLESLVKCGALDRFGVERNTLLENMELITKFIQTARKEMQSNQNNLFGNVFDKNVSASVLDLKPAKPASSEEKLAWEKELLGLYVSEHPLNLATEKLAGAKPTAIKKMLEERSTSRSYRLAGMVTSAKNIVTKTGKPMAFVKLEDLSGSVEMVVFPDVYAEKKSLFEEGKLVVVLGRLSFRNGDTSVICEAVKELK